jgi:hypothetical protein
MSPLVYIFAVGAGVLAALALITAVLTYQHARTRSKRARDLYDYLASARFSGRLQTESAQYLAEHQAVPDNREQRRIKQRTKVMHLTVGDLVRDEELANMATAGARPGAVPQWRRGNRPSVRIEPTDAGLYSATVMVPWASEIPAQEWVEHVMEILPFLEAVEADAQNRQRQELQVSGRVDRTDRGLYAAEVTALWDTEERAKRSADDIATGMLRDFERRYAPEAEPTTDRVEKPAEHQAESETGPGDADASQRDR